MQYPLQRKTNPKTTETGYLNPICPSKPGFEGIFIPIPIGMGMVILVHAGFYFPRSFSLYQNGQCFLRQRGHTILPWPSNSRSNGCIWDIVPDSLIDYLNTMKSTQGRVQFEPFPGLFCSVFTLPWVSVWVGEDRLPDFRTK